MILYIKLCAGVYYGTIMHRVDATVLRFVPGFIKDPLKKIIGKVVGMGKQGLNLTAGKLTDTLVNRCAPPVCCPLRPATLLPSTPALHAPQLAGRLAARLCDPIVVSCPFP
jgi:hypothetical protein